MAIPVPSKHVADFEKLGFGMFIHYGLYSQRGEGEWALHIQKIPMEEYSKLFHTFTASDFDAIKIAKLAKRAGMKYITLTTRHHEGFSLYDTRGLSTFDSIHSPAMRDLVAEFVVACRQEGIVPMLYHTTLDWYQESFEKDFDGYLEYLRQSVEVLCRNYGEIGGLWFDGNWSKPNADWKLDELYGTIRKYQPNAMIINNTGLGARGELGHPELDSVTFEQGRPEPMNREGMSKYVSAEMCQTMNNHWGFGKEDFAYKSSGQLIETLCACRKVGANYLLNVGPTGQGAIPKMQEALLEIVGDWIRLYGRAIYDVKPSVIKGNGDDFALEAPDGTVYLFITKTGVEGDDNVTVAKAQKGSHVFHGMTQKVNFIRFLDEEEEQAFEQDGDVLIVNPKGNKYGKSHVVRVAEIK